jgi:hypothetical protein
MKIEPKVWRLSPKYEDWAQSMKIEPKVWRLSPKYEDRARSMKIEPDPGTKKSGPTHLYSQSKQNIEKTA